jgi:hypothetical protein
MRACPLRKMTMNRPHDQTELIAATRANLLELLAVAVCIALGVHLVGGGVLLQMGWPTLAVTALGAGLIILGCGYLVARVAPRLSRRFSFQGVLAVTGKSHEVIPIDRYEFAEDTAEHVRALAAENKALARAWADNPLSEIELDIKNQTAAKKGSPAAKLAREALEYFVLNELSLLLSGHFENNPRIDAAEIVRMGRRDIPSVLLENRFLELFSRPMAEREAFLPSVGSETEHGVSYASGKGGAIFDQFELILPRGTQVSRVDADTVLVRTRRFSMRIEAAFQGFGANLPCRFAELYLGRGFHEVDTYQIDLDIHVKFRWWSLLTAVGWEYYRWVDLFLDRIAQGFSFERFLQDIGWNTALSAAIVAKRLGEASGKNRGVRGGVS